MPTLARKTFYFWGVYFCRVRDLTRLSLFHVPSSAHRFSPSRFRQRVTTLTFVLSPPLLSVRRGGYCAVGSLGQLPGLSSSSCSALAVQGCMRAYLALCAGRGRQRSANFRCRGRTTSRRSMHGPSSLTGHGSQMFEPELSLANTLLPPIQRRLRALVVVIAPCVEAFCLATSAGVHDKLLT